MFSFNASECTKNDNKTKHNQQQNNQTLLTRKLISALFVFVKTNKNNTMVK